MYSMVMVVAMVGAPEAPGCHNHGSAVCCTPTPVVTQSCETGHSSCHGLGFGHRLKKCFSGLCHRHRSSDCCETVSTSTPECGTVVIPPAHVDTPKAPVKDMPKVIDQKKPADSKLGPAPGETKKIGM